MHTPRLPIGALPGLATDMTLSSVFSLFLMILSSFHLSLSSQTPARLACDILLIIIW